MACQKVVQTLIEYYSELKKSTQGKIKISIFWKITFYQSFSNEPSIRTQKTMSVPFVEFHKETIVFLKIKSYKNKNLFFQTFKEFLILRKRDFLLNTMKRLNNTCSITLEKGKTIEWALHRKIGSKYLRENFLYWVK